MTDWTEVESLYHATLYRLKISELNKNIKALATAKTVVDKYVERFEVQESDGTTKKLVVVDLAPITGLQKDYQLTKMTLMIFKRLNESDNPDVSRPHIQGELLETQTHFADRGDKFEYETALPKALVTKIAPIVAGKKARRKK